MDVPTVVEAVGALGVATWVQPGGGGRASNAGDVVQQGEVNNSWEAIGGADRRECSGVLELCSDVSAVALNAAKKWDDALCGGPICVGTLDCTGFETRVRDVIDHVNSATDGICFWVMK